MMRAMRRFGRVGWIGETLTRETDGGPPTEPTLGAGISEVLAV
jgi:hypothetical protein